MKSSPLLLCATLAACGGDGGSSPPDGGGPPPDAAVDAAPPEPKPAFDASPYVAGSLAIDDAGLRATFSVGGVTEPSRVTVSLTAAGTTTPCEVTLRPAFVSFSTASTSTRQFKTAVLDFATSTVHEDKCKWDDAYILERLAAQFGNYIVGFAQARFAEDRPRIDVFLDAVQPFPNQTANIVLAGGGYGYAMAAGGTINVNALVEPTPGTLVPALYEW